MCLNLYVCLLESVSGCGTFNFLFVQTLAVTTPSSASNSHFLFSASPFNRFMLMGAEERKGPDMMYSHDQRESRASPGGAARAVLAPRLTHTTTAIMTSQMQCFSN